MCSRYRTRECVISGVRLKEHSHNPRIRNCPSCGSGDLHAIYRQPGIPTNSCLLSSSRRGAEEWSRADLELSVCRSCGFIFNALFQANLVSYDASYEDQQRHSPTFSRFAMDLATGLIEKYDLWGKRILEIGCGKADFLHLLCSLGNNTGFGIDPAVNPNRQAEVQTSSVSLMAEPFGLAHASLKPDWICCRHTLEHINETREFLSLVRSCIGSREDIAVFFEVPDASRILSQGAFEDIYYEHCSYFSAGALARLFRLSGFQVVDLYRGYGDQYLMIEALPANLPDSKPNELEESVVDVVLAAERLSGRVADNLAGWQETISQPGFGTGAVWGSGSKCVAFLEAVGDTERFPWVVDINPHRQGRFLPGSGLEVLAPEALTALRPDSVIIMNAQYEKEIRAQLRQMNVDAAVYTL